MPGLYIATFPHFFTFLEGKHFKAKIFNSFSTGAYFLRTVLWCSTRVHLHLLVFTRFHWSSTQGEYMKNIYKGAQLIFGPNFFFFLGGAVGKDSLTFLG